jgi:hypothetical protein
VIRGPAPPLPSSHTFLFIASPFIVYPLLYVNFLQALVMLEAAGLGRDVIYTDVDVLLREDYRDRLATAQAYVVGTCE